MTAYNVNSFALSNIIWMSDYTLGRLAWLLDEYKKADTRDSRVMLSGMIELRPLMDGFSQMLELTPEQNSIIEQVNKIVFSNNCQLNIKEKVT